MSQTGAAVALTEATQFQAFGAASMYVVLLITIIVVAHKQVLAVFGLARRDWYGFALGMFAVVCYLLCLIILYTSASAYGLVGATVSLVVVTVVGTQSFAHVPTLTLAMGVWFLVLIGLPEAICGGILLELSKQNCNERFAGYDATMCTDGWVTATLFFAFGLIGLTLLQLLMLCTLAIRLLESQLNKRGDEPTAVTSGDDQCRYQPLKN